VTVTDVAASGSDHSASSSSNLPPPVSLLANRRDAPKVMPWTAKGTRPSDPLSNEDRLRLMSAYEGDVRARSATASSESLWRTWVFYHKRWFGEQADPLPITVGSLKAVVAQLKDQKYASIGNMISVAKDRHVGAQYSWSEFLVREARRGTRTGTRGKGAPHQDDEFDLDSAFALGLGEEPLCPGGPCNTMLALEVGAFHVLREIELSTALASSVTFNPDSLEETFALPVSKTDPKAIGCTRTWGCVCDGTHNKPCCYHAMVDQFEWLTRSFPETPFEELPLFPQPNGEVVEKEAMVRTIEKVAELLGEPLRDQQGRRRFGGHSLRVLGSRRLARLAIPIVTIMLLARWASTIIMRYIKDAPLKALTCEYRVRASARTYSLEDASKAVGKNCRKALEADTTKYQEQQDKLEKLLARLDALEEKAALPKYVENRASGVLHRADTSDPAEFGGVDRVTPCGWHYHGCNSVRHKMLPPFLAARLICSRCLKFERAAAMVESSVSSSTSSDEHMAV